MTPFCIVALNELSAVLFLHVTQHDIDMIFLFCISSNIFVIIKVNQLIAMKEKVHLPINSVLECI